MRRKSVKFVCAILVMALAGTMAWHIKADQQGDYEEKSFVSSSPPQYVVLVHGSLRRGGDMRYLAKKLEQQGYHTFSPTLPTTFQNVRACEESLALMLDRRFPEGSVVHFVGHSMGGLVIREHLSRKEFEGLGRVVLIGTPSGGSPYANLLLRLPFSRQIFKSLPDLAEPGRDIPPPLNVPPPEIGIIIGTRSDLLRKKFLPGEHDGLVPAKSARNMIASDELAIPYTHHRLHWQPDTAEAVILFLEMGSFRK